MSVKLEIYQAIKTKLQTLAEIKNVLHYNGQDTLNFEKDITRRFPQCLIQFSDITWKPSELSPYNKNRTRQQKSNSVVITVYTVFFNLKEDEDTFEADLLTVDRVYRALTQLNGDHFTELERVSESDVLTNNNVRVWAQSFSSMLTEQAEALTLVDVSPVELEIIKSTI